MAVNMTDVAPGSRGSKRTQASLNALATVIKDFTTGETMDVKTHVRGALSLGLASSWRTSLWKSLLSGKLQDVGDQAAGGRGEELGTECSTQTDHQETGGDCEWLLKIGVQGGLFLSFTWLRCLCEVEWASSCPCPSSPVRG